MQNRMGPLPAWQNWKKVCGVLAGIVVFVTTYAMILPAITLDSEAVCGLSEHVHGEDCYEAVLICDLEEEEGHVHGTECYDADGNQICALAETGGHTHTEDCYELVLACGREEHTHSDTCYAAEDTAAGETVADGTADQTTVEEAGSEASDTAEISAIEYTAQADGVSVTAVAGEGALPEGVSLCVSLIEDEDALAEAAAVLEEGGISYDGFTSLDLCFIDEEGNEVEPESGSVAVRIELDAGILPEDADTDTLAVQHLAAESGSLDAALVASADGTADGTVAVEDGLMTVEFEVESFSTFTITWSSEEELETADKPGSGPNSGPGDQDGNGSTELNIDNYQNTSHVCWDTNDSNTTKAKGTTLISEVTLNALSVTYADSTTVDTASWSTGTTLTNYFPNTDDGEYYTGGTSGSSYKNDAGTVSLTITPADGYYVTSVVIACCPTRGGDDATQLTPYSCSTWEDGNATTQEFKLTDATNGSVTMEVGNLSFSHTSSSSYYFILITVAPIPTPVYVEYSYGDIVDSLTGEECETSAFSTATGWTATGTGNVYTYSDDENTEENGVQTHDVQYIYTYDDDTDSTEDATNWKHYANSITEEALAQAEAGGYVFVGWEVTYYYTCTSTANSSTGTYEDDYYNYDYTFSSTYGVTFANPGDEVKVTTHMRLVAIWIKPEIDGSLAISKTVSGTGTPEDTTHYTFTIQGTDTASSTEESGAATTTYDIDGTYTITFTGTDDCTASSHGSSVTSSTGDDGGTVYSITFTGGSATLYLADGESAVISGLETGLAVTITESSTNLGDITTYVRTVNTVDNVASKESYTAETTVPVPTTYTVNTTATPIKNDDGEITGYTYTYSLSDYTEAIRQIAFTNWYSKFEILKVDSEDETQTLSGAEFVLYMQDSSGNKTYYDSTGNVTEEAECLTTDDSGKITVNGLPDGTYILCEIAAPDGYNLLGTSITLTMEEGKVTASGSTEVDVQTGSDGVVTVTVKNSAGEALPQTGGPGTYWITFSGLLLTAAALIVSVQGRARRKEERK